MIRFIWLALMIIPRIAYAQYASGPSQDSLNKDTAFNQRAEPFAQAIKEAMVADLCGLRGDGWYQAIYHGMNAEDFLLVTEIFGADSANNASSDSHFGHWNDMVQTSVNDAASAPQSDCQLMQINGALGTLDKIATQAGYQK